MDIFLSRERLPGAIVFRSLNMVLRPGRLLPSLIILVMVTMAQAAKAQAEVLTIINYRNDNVKVCAYRHSDDRLIRCWTIGAKESVTWNRGNDKSYFNVRVWQPALIDKLLCQRKELSNAPQLRIISPCGIVRHDPRPKPVPKPGGDYVVRVCNRTPDDTVYFALMYALLLGPQREEAVSEGWWKLGPDECQDIAMNNRGFETLKGFGIAGYIYGETEGIVQKVWEGENTNVRFCVSTDKDRQFKLIHNPGLKACRSGYERVLGRKITIKPGVTLWDFQ